MSTKSVCSSQYIVTDQHRATGTHKSTLILNTSDGCKADPSLGYQPTGDPLSVRSAAIYPSTIHHCSLTNVKLHWLVTKPRVWTICPEWQSESGMANSRTCDLWQWVWYIRLCHTFRHNTSEIISTDTNDMPCHTQQITRMALNRVLSDVQHQ